MTEQEAIQRAYNHDRPDHYRNWAEDLEVLATVADDDIERIYSRLNGEG